MVGGCKGGLGVRCGFVDRSDSDACASVQRGACDINCCLGDHPLNCARDSDSVAVAGVGEQNGELITTDPGRDVGPSHAFVDREGDGFQHVVTGFVAVRVVDFFELVGSISSKAAVSP